MQRCALYVRVSTDKQETENQLAVLRDFAAKQGWQIMKEFVDVVSGGTADRLEFQAMLKAASQRRFDVLLFWSLDRFSRQGALATLQYLNRLSDFGIAYRSFSEPYLDSCGLFGDVIVSLLATLAKQEKQRISERTKAGLERARRQGKVLGRRRVQADEKELSVIRAGIESGLSLAVIGEQLGISAATVCRRARTIA